MKRSIALIFASLFLTGPVAAQDAPASAVAGTVPFAESVLISGLKGPWEITWGPDDMLWVTERTAGRIIRVNPKDGSQQTAIVISDVVSSGGQDGLLGMALDPGLLKGTGHDFVYTAYTYKDAVRPAVRTRTDPADPYLHIYTKLIRLTYDPAKGTLSDPVTLIDGLPAGSDHNSGRMARFITPSAIRATTSSPITACPFRPNACRLPTKWPPRITLPIRASRCD